METATLAKNYFNPYTKKKLLHNGEEWRQYKELTDADIISHFTGEKTLGYFSKYQTHIIAFDIDVHGNFFDESFRETRLRSAYYNIIQMLGIHPSLVFRTRIRGGFHVYYKLTHKIFFRVITSALAKKLIANNLTGIDLRPTPTQGLRFPLNVKNGGYLVNPATLEKAVSQDLKQAIDSAPIYRPEEITGLFFGKCFEKVSCGKQAAEYAGEMRFMRYAEKHLADATAGNTNKAICSIAYNGKVNGYAPEDVADFITEQFISRGIPLKKDTQGAGLLRRIKSVYRKNKDYLVKDFQRKTAQQDFLILGAARQGREIIENIISLHGTRLKAIEKFLYEMFNWTQYVRAMTIYEKLSLNSVYNYFYHYTHNRHLTPLPRSLLKKWHSRYNETMSLLARAGILRLEKKAFKKWGTDLQGNCHYYRVSIPGFKNG